MSEYDEKKKKLHKHEKKPKEESPKEALHKKVEVLRHLAREEYHEAVRKAGEHHKMKEKARHILREELRALRLLKEEDYGGL